MDRFKERRVKLIDIDEEKNGDIALEGERERERKKERKEGRE